jgi:hypothetical protein
MNFTKEQIEGFEKEHALREFLEVSAPDRTVGNLYYNKKGEGLLETFPNSLKLEEHQEGKRTYFTNENGEVFEVAKIEPYILTKQKRLGENEEDFQEIYNREFEVSELKDNPEEHLHFKKEILSKKVKGLIEFHTNQVGETKINAPITFLAKKFLEYIQNPIKSKPNNNNISLEDLFRDKDQYHKIFSELEKDGIIIKSRDGFIINKRRVIENKLEVMKAICALGYLLDGYNFLKSRDGKLIIALNSLFDMEISKQTYYSAKKSFINGDYKADDYYKLFYCLPKPKEFT